MAHSAAPPMERAQELTMARLRADEIAVAQAPEFPPEDEEDEIY